MYRLLIVDDEPYIVNGLADMCSNAERLDLEVYRAYSSSEALNWLKRTKIDIVLSDIKMPGMSGLELLREIHKQWPRCKVIFLTGYDDFSYIHEAIRLGSVDYILKTEGNDTVLAAIEKAVQLLNEELETSSLVAKSKEQLKTALPFLQKQYLWDLLQADPKALQSMERHFVDLSIPLKTSEPCLLLLCRVDDWNDHTAPSDRALLLYAIQNITEELLRASTSLVAVEYERFKIVWLIQHKSDAQDEEIVNAEVLERTTRFVHGMLEQIQAVCSRLLRLRISFAAANEWVDWKNLACKFESLQLLFRSGLGIGKELLITESMLREDRPVDGVNWNGYPRMYAKKIERLKACLENGDQVEFFNVFSDVMNISAVPTEVVHTLKLEIYFTLVSVFLPYANDLRTLLTGEESGTVIDFNKLIRYEDHATWSDVIEYFSAMAEEIFARKVQGKDAKEHDIVRKVRQYIADHLSGDLSLTQIGEAVGLNPSYLSRLYKQITGEGLSDAIAEARLSKAKQLLLESSWKINDIAAAVGFVSPPYFYRFFKKATNLTPQEYRELHNK